MTVYKYCPLCGADLKERSVEFDNRPRLVCESCHYIHYVNPVPAVAVIILNEMNEVVLVKRKYEPMRGYWSLPAGFLENDETVEQTALREVKEETNLNIRLNGLFGVYSADDNPDKKILLVVYRGDLISGTPEPGDDAEEAGYFPLQGLPENIAFRCHREILKQLIREIS